MKRLSKDVDADVQASFVKVKGRRVMSAGVVGANDNVSGETTGLLYSAHKVGRVLAGTERGRDPCSERIYSWNETNDGGVRVRTDQRVYVADQLVLAAGAWNHKLADALDGLAVPERQALA